MGDDQYSTNLPPGFRFFPSDEELVVHFLCRKAARQPCNPDIVPTIDLQHCDPWDLNGQALQGDDGQWYFFTLNTQRRHAAPNGYWETVGGLDEPVSTSCGDRVGTKRTLVFYLGEDPEGIKTNWVMHEYHLLHGVASSTSTNSTRRSSKKRGSTRTETNKWVICRVYETAACGSHDGGGRELSCLDEVFLSMDDDLDEVSLPY